MEQSPNQSTRPTSRFKSIAKAIFDRFYAEPFPVNQYKIRRDVGKSAAEAAQVQLVLEGMEGFLPEPPEAA